MITILNIERQKDFDEETEYAFLNLSDGSQIVDVFPFLETSFSHIHFPIMVEKEEGQYTLTSFTMGDMSEEEYQTKLFRVNKQIEFFYFVKDLLSVKKAKDLMENFSDVCSYFKEEPFRLLDIHYEDRPYFYFPDIDKRAILRTFDDRVKEWEYLCRYLLQKNCSSGNTWMYYKDFKREFLDILKKDSHPMNHGNFSAIINFFSSFLYVERPLSPTSRVALTTDKAREDDILKCLKTHKNSRTPFPKYKPTTPDFLTEEQKTAVKEAVACKGNLSIITGGPGTGKTTVLSSIITEFSSRYPGVMVALLAPTGKAVKRMKETLSGLPIDNFEISTIHKFVGYGKSFITKAEREEKTKGGLIVIDESSMMDLEIFNKLLFTIDFSKSKVILLGDENQLPSISQGNILHDLIWLGIPTFYLTKNHRNAGSIAENAKKIMSGEIDLVQDDDFQIIDQMGEASYLGCCVDQYHATLFSPYRQEGIKGSTSQMNQSITGRGLKGRQKYHVGDQIIVCKTNYKRGYINGDTGTYAGYYNGEHHIKLDGFDDEIGVLEETDIDLGYALTIHKSQGSEYDNISICIPTYSPFITRRMLYTAITRAKKQVRIYSSLPNLIRIIMNTGDEQRNTFLSLAKL